MLVPFNTIPEDARVWVYQSDRRFDDNESKQCLLQTEKFINDWTAHQANLKAGVQVLFNRFIVIAVDSNYNEASGCSIDKKVNFIKQLGVQLNADFFNRMKIAYIDGDLIQVSDMHEFAEQVKTGKLSDQTIMFNNLITTVKEFNESWKIQVKNSWMHQLVAS